MTNNDVKQTIAIMWAEPHGRRMVAHTAAWIATSVLMLAAVSLIGGNQLFEPGYHPGSAVTLGDLTHMTVAAAGASLLMAAFIALQVWFAGRLVGLCLVGPKMRGDVPS